MKKLKAQYKITGGIHPQYHKNATAEKPIQVMPIPSLLRVSMAQHLGAPSKPVVKKGDTVLRGQIIGEPNGFISATVHAPTSGVIKAVTKTQTIIGKPADSIDIEPDGKDQWISNSDPQKDWTALKTDQLIKMVSDAGIAGMGGAGFPTHVKLSPPTDKPIDTIIINGAECEPYLTADHRLMVEHSKSIWQGCLILQKILGAETIRIAIEDNKPDAIVAMEKAIDNSTGDIGIVILETKYPHGAEKQQIYAITGREVPSGGLPMDVGTVVENVGTTMAVWNAVINRKPVTERVTTVTGSPVNKPGNVLARLGTTYTDLLDFCGGLSGNYAKIISGGPMMGFAQGSSDISTTKTTSGILILSPDEISDYTSMPCISCGRCVEACPSNLLPCDLSQMLEAEDYNTPERYNLMDCIECGCCAFVCPARRPLVQHMRRGKSQILLQRRSEKEKK